MIDYRKLGIQDKYFAFGIQDWVDLLYPSIRKIVINKLKEKIDYFEIFQCPNWIVFVKNEDGLNEVLKISGRDKSFCIKID
jgi:hypothetical protein